MKIYSILSYAEALEESGLLVEYKVTDPTAAIEGITYNSKECKKFTLFACKGAAFKKQYLDDAVDSGIACYMSEIKYDTLVPVSYIIVSDIRKAMALVADIFYDRAYSKLVTIGITGTKGKSTTAYFLKFILDEYLQEAGEKPCGLLSTISVYDGKTAEDAHLTTPEAFELHRHLDNAVSAGLKYFILEVSSQALKYDRVCGVEFDYGLFLNLSNDHISPIEHKDFDDYFGSKLKLFEQTKTAVVNLDSDCACEICAAADKCERKIGFSMNGESLSLNGAAGFFGGGVAKKGGDIVFWVSENGETSEYSLSVSGLFNAENALAAVAVARDLGIEKEIIKRGLYKAHIPGRMEVQTSKNGSIAVIVDYAHNKLSFEKLYASIKEEYKGFNIITVFGCPGNKANNRRRELGELSSHNSSRVYLTADDPGSENLGDINREIKKYMSAACECFEIEDRAKAVEEAILSAPPKSVIVLAGKGHENCHKINGKLVYIESDFDAARRVMKTVDERISRAAEQSL